MCLNIGGLRPVSHLELVQTLIAVAQAGRYRIVPFPADRARIDIGSAYSSNESAERVLGWRPTIDLADGLGRSVEFLRRHKEAYW
jgi:nucleoside-diphosphate-sugar epimerase